MLSLQHFSIIFIIHARSFLKLFSSILKAFPPSFFRTQQVFCYGKQSYGWWGIDWVVFFSFGCRNKRMRVNIHGTRACVVCHPIWPDKSLLCIESFQGEATRGDTLGVLSAPQQLLRNQMWIINNSWPPLGWVFKDLKLNGKTSREGASENCMRPTEAEFIGVADGNRAQHLNLHGITHALHFYCRKFCENRRWLCLNELNLQRRRQSHKGLFSLAGEMSEIAVPKREREKFEK